MSKYTGKCDVYDSVIMIHEATDEEIKTKYRIYPYGHKIPLRIDSIKDLMPYFPYLIVIGFSDGATGERVIELSRGSYIDKSEKEVLDVMYERVMKQYRKLRREKQPINHETLILEFYHDDPTSNYRSPFNEAYTKIANRIIMEHKTEKEDVLYDMHLQRYDVSRMMLYNDMVDAGWNEMMAADAIFGFSRWTKEKDELMKLRED